MSVEAIIFGGAFVALMAGYWSTWAAADAFRRMWVGR